MLNFLTPGFFDILVIGVAIVGLIIAAMRIRNDFQRGPRWPDNPPIAPKEPNLEEMKND